MSKKSARKLYQQELRKLLSYSNAPPTPQSSTISMSSLFSLLNHFYNFSGSDNENLEYGVLPDESKQEETNENPHATVPVSKQIIDGWIFHLPIEYTGSKILGVGAHGLVAAAATPSGDKQIAVKKIKLNIKPLCDDDEILSQWRSGYCELSLLIQLKRNGVHPNVIDLMDALLISISETEYDLMFLTKLMETSLENLMQTKSLTDTEKKLCIYKILCGLAYLHANNISE